MFVDASDPLAHAAVAADEEIRPDRAVIPHTRASPPEGSWLRLHAASNETKYHQWMPWHEAARIDCCTRIVERVVVENILGHDLSSLVSSLRSTCRPQTLRRWLGRVKPVGAHIEAHDARGLRWPETSGVKYM